MITKSKMIKDIRLEDYNDFDKEKREKPYKALFRNNPFSQIDLAIHWLTTQLNQKWSSEDVQIKVLFEQAIQQSNIVNLIKNGDTFYTDLFDNACKIPQGSEDLRSETPFFDALKEIYSNLWDFGNEIKSRDLIVYSELSNYIQELMGISVGNDLRYKNFSDWLKISECTQHFGNFYKPWIKAIPPKLVENNLAELAHLDEKTELHEIAEIMSYRGDKAKEFSKTHEKTIENLKNKSSWEFINEVTDNSDYIYFDNTLQLKEFLILKLEIKYWLKFIDELRWPVLQDSAFYSIKEIKLLEKIIELIIEQDSILKTKSEHLLLIVLKNYFDLVKEISTNLFDWKEGRWDYNLKGDIQVKDKFTVKYNNWFDNELAESSRKVFDLIFKTEPVSKSKHFADVFEWINSYKKSNYLNVHYSVPILKTLKIISTEFEKCITQDSESKHIILKNTPIEKQNWEIFEKLIALYQTDETDTKFRDLLLGRFIEYLGSDAFKWNLSGQYNNIEINQANYLAYLILRCDDPLKIWYNLFSDFKYLHEGWLLIKGMDNDAKKKEVYVLLAGGCVAYNYYEMKEPARAREVFDKVQDIVFSQYRVVSSLRDDQYTQVLQFMASLFAHNEPFDIDKYIKRFDDKCDSLEHFLIVVNEIMQVNKEKPFKINSDSVDLIRKRINAGFDLIQKRYKNLQLKNQLDFFEALKTGIFDTLNKISPISEA